MFFVFKLFFGKSASLATIALFPAITAGGGEVCVARSPLSGSFRRRNNQLRAVFHRNSGHRIGLRYSPIISPFDHFQGVVTGIEIFVYIGDQLLGQYLSAGKHVNSRTAILRPGMDGEVRGS